MSFLSNLTNTNLCPFPFPDSNLKIPSTNYKLTMRKVTPDQTSPNSTSEVKSATIYIQVEGWYKLYVQPLKDHPPVSMENDFIMSPKFTYKFNLPLVYLTNTPLSVSYVSKELAKLPMSSGLATYLQPHIVQNVVSLAQKSPANEFKVAFDVKVVKIDLADHGECDGYRRRGLIN